MQIRRTVAILTDTSTAYSRGVLRGISRHALGEGRWQIHMRAVWDFAPDPVIDWSGVDGIIAEVPGKDRLKWLIGLGRPTINVSNIRQPTPFSGVHADDELVGRMAADYFVSLGYRHFGFFGYMWMAVAQDRLAGFSSGLADAGFDPKHVFVLDGTGKSAGLWAASLPKPVAVFTMSDGAAGQLLDNCRLADVRVPEQLAVLGVDNDEFRTSLSVPTLSSIVLPAERIGYEAALLLDDLLNGKPIPGPEVPILVPPLRVVTRQSTDLIAIDDHKVAEAVMFIRDHACINPQLDIKAICQAVHVGRRVLERRFRNLLGRTILDELQRVRVEEAKRLLDDTELSMPSVAERSGFANTNHYNSVFRRITGGTPTDYRFASRATRRVPV